MQKRAVFCVYVSYILRAIGAGRCRERRYADHIFIQIYFRMHHHFDRFRSQIFKKKFRPRRQGGIDPPTKILRTFLIRYCSVRHHTERRSASLMHSSGAARGEGGEASPLWVDVQKLCNMCVLSLSWNFIVSHDKYIARASSKEPR